MRLFEYLAEGVLAVVVLVTAAWLGKTYGRRLRAGAAFVGAVLFGFGTVLDPPARHASESVNKENEDETSGEPKA